MYIAINTANTPPGADLVMAALGSSAGDVELLDDQAVVVFKVSVATLVTAIVA
jgi:hypothetical protein